jgi:hypothetical protein
VKTQVINIEDRQIGLLQAEIYRLDRKSRGTLMMVESLFRGSSYYLSIPEKTGC